MRLSTILIALPTLLAAGCATSPTGRSQLLLVPEQQMAQMGDAAFAQMRQADPVSADDAARRHVACVVSALTAELDPPWRSIEWKSELFAASEPNAFALPGGNVGVNAGLLQVARNQHQLAAVIGHEIGHVVARHANARVSQTQLAQVGVDVIGAYAGRATSPRNTQLLVAALGAGTQVGVLLPYARAQEREADVIGQRLMAEAGFDPAAAVELWRNMMAASGPQGRPPEFLSTHPDPAARLQTLQDRVPELAPVAQAARRSGRGPDCE